MVITLMIPMRLIYGLEDFITERHLNNMAKVMLASGLIVGYGYFMEQLISWYSASVFENFMMQNRMHGPLRPLLLGLDCLQHSRAAAPVV